MEGQMNCTLSKVNGLIWSAIAVLLAAIGAAWLWMTALPLFAAAAMAASVTVFFIPEIRQAIEAYVKCRGPSDWCKVTRISDALGQAAALLGTVAFAAAGALQLVALAAVASVLLSWWGVGMMAAVGIMVAAGTFACALAILWLLYAALAAERYKKCMDSRRPEDVDMDGAMRG